MYNARSQNNAPLLKSRANVRKAHKHNVAQRRLRKVRDANGANAPLHLDPLVGLGKLGNTADAKSKKLASACHAGEHLRCGKRVRVSVFGSAPCPHSLISGC